MNSTLGRLGALSAAGASYMASNIAGISTVAARHDPGKRRKGPKRKIQDTGYGSEQSMSECVRLGSECPTRGQAHRTGLGGHDVSPGRAGARDDLVEHIPDVRLQRERAIIPTAK